MKKAKTNNRGTPETDEPDIEMILESGGESGNDEDFKCSYEPYSNDTRWRKMHTVRSLLEVVSRALLISIIQK